MAKPRVHELAKEFGGTDGHKYVNAVLNGLAPRLRPAEVEADRASGKRTRKNRYRSARFVRATGIGRSRPSGERSSIAMTWGRSAAARPAGVGARQRRVPHRWG